MDRESAIYRSLENRRKNMTYRWYYYEPIHFVTLENLIIRLDV